MLQPAVVAETDRLAEPTHRRLAHPRLLGELAARCHGHLAGVLDEVLADDPQRRRQPHRVDVRPELDVVAWNPHGHATQYRPRRAHRSPRLGSRRARHRASTGASLRNRCDIVPTRVSGDPVRTASTRARSGRPPESAHWRSGAQCPCVRSMIARRDGRESCGRATHGASRTPLCTRFASLPDTFEDTDNSRPIGTSMTRSPRDLVTVLSFHAAMPGRRSRSDPDRQSRTWPKCRDRSRDRTRIPTIRGTAVNHSATCGDGQRARRESNPQPSDP